MLVIRERSLVHELQCTACGRSAALIGVLYVCAGKFRNGMVTTRGAKTTLNALVANRERGVLDVVLVLLGLVENHLDEVSMRPSHGPPRSKFVSKNTLRRMGNILNSKDKANPTPTYY